MNGVIKTCAWCGASFYGDGRHKYCSEDCAAAKHREDAKLRFRRRYVEKHEEELARNRKYYANNKEKVFARVRRFLDKNPKYLSGKQHNWYMKNRERVIARVQEYQCARKAATS